MEEMSTTARAAVRLVDALPAWLGSVRFRLTAIYSLVLFGLTAFTVAGVYGVLDSLLGDEYLYRSYQVTRVEPVPGGVILTPTQVQSCYRRVARLANERGLSLLRAGSASALLLLFLVGLLGGWWVAGDTRARGWSEREVGPTAGLGSAKRWTLPARWPRAAGSPTGAVSCNAISSPRM